MPGVSPELGSPVSGANPSQLRRVPGSAAEGSHGVGSGPLDPVGLGNGDGVAEHGGYFAFPPSG